MMIKMIVIMKSLLCKPKTACDRANIVSELLFFNGVSKCMETHRPLSLKEINMTYF